MFKIIYKIIVLFLKFLQVYLNYIYINLFLSFGNENIYVFLIIKVFCSNLLFLFCKKLILTYFFLIFMKFIYFKILALKLLHNLKKR